MITGRPRARHAHQPARRGRVLLPPRRQAAQLTGGPLAGLTAYVDPGATTVRAPGHAGRYVRTDADQWAWETDHREETGR